MKPWMTVPPMAAMLALAGCQTASAPPADMVWMRLDGKKMASDPALQQEFFAAMNSCQTQLAAVQNGAPPQQNVTVNQTMTIGSSASPRPRSFSASEFIAASEAGARANQQEAMFMSCMGGHGYRYGPRPPV